MPNPSLRLSPPNSIHYAGHSAPCGVTVYLAVQALLDAGGRLPRAAFCRAVWRRQKASGPALWSLCHRVSELLNGLGYPERCGVDDGEVLLF